jgi:hypothetical protein
MLALLMVVRRARVVLFRVRRSSVAGGFMWGSAAMAECKAIKHSASRGAVRAMQHQAMAASTRIAPRHRMEIVLNARLVPVELRRKVQEVVQRFTFGPQGFLWVALPSEDLVLSLPPVIVQSFGSPHDDAGRLLKEGIEDEILGVLDDSLHRDEPGQAADGGR